MTTFNDLITDLTKENLLDEATRSLHDTTDKLNFSKFYDAPEFSEITLPHLLSVSENYELKLPDFSVLKPETDTYFDENQVKNVFPANDPTVTFQNTQNLIKFQTRRRIKKISKGSKYCSTCACSVSGLSLHCRFCRQRVVSDLYYYSLVGLGLVIFTILIWLIITSKSYK